jgi:uncharacterized membrane protein
MMMMVTTTRMIHRMMMMLTTIMLVVVMDLGSGSSGGGVWNPFRTTFIATTTMAFTPIHSSTFLLRSTTSHYHHQNQYHHDHHFPSTNVVSKMLDSSVSNGETDLNHHLDKDTSMNTGTVATLLGATMTVLPALLLQPMTASAMEMDTAISSSLLLSSSLSSSLLLSISLSPTWNSALLAYGHYFFILLGTILLCYERFTVEANMSVEKEKSLVIADALYGIVGAALAGTGYFRVISEYGKGWDYYAHEPLFWLKLTAAGLLAGLSLFPTITFIQRGSKIFQNDTTIEPMSEALATRIRKVLNAELSAILSVPLLATLMARGVAYQPDFPWQLGAGLTVLTLVGSGAFYAQKALTWTEPSES